MAPRKKQPDVAEIARILDQIDVALLANDTAQIEPLTGQLWAARDEVVEVVEARLIAGQARVPAFAFELLNGFGGPDAENSLARIAAAPLADDLTRFGARRRLGWQEYGEKQARLRFLQSLSDADTTLVEAAREGAVPWPQNSEVLQEVLLHLNALPARRRQALTEQIAALDDVPRPWVLHALVHAADKTTQRAALKALTSGDAPGADGPLARLAQVATDPKLRAESEAARSLARAQSWETEALPPLDRAYLSMLDGDGGQVVLLTRRLGESVVIVVNIFHQEEIGIKGVFGSSWLPDEVADGMVEELEEAGIAMIEVPLAAIRGALADAVAVNAAAGKGLPTVYELWEPLLHDSYPPVADEAILSTVLDDAPYAGRQDLLARSDDLFAHPFFQYWGFDPDQTTLAMDLAPPPDGELTDTQYRPLLAALTPPEVRARFRRRLCRQAWLLEQIDDTATRDVALAASAALATDDEAALLAHPFLREMITMSVAQVMLAWGEI